jgi:demethylmenaquinone methyltransferase/2-methoxy-6-polyprenyl-1,4-benzoquinol methylase
LAYNEHIASQFLYKGRRIQGSSHVGPEVRKCRDRVKHRVGNAVRKSVSSLHAKRTLDVGTGFGSNVRVLAQEFMGKGKIWSIDPSAKVLREIRRMLRSNSLLKDVKLVRAKAEDMPFDDEFFNLVTSVMLVHHLANPRKGLMEMVRVLRDGGKLVIVDWRPITSEVIPHRARDFADPERIHKILTRLGISVRLRNYRYWYLIQGIKTAT